MSKETAHEQPRNGRGFGTGDSGLMELQDLNEEGTAVHLDLDRLRRLLDQVDEELDLVAAERTRVLEHLRRLHQRERKANHTIDAIRTEFRRLNELGLDTHREAGRRGCELQAERLREGRAPKVHVERVDRMEVR